jgi:hypothetical protein
MVCQSLFIVIYLNGSNIFSAFFIFCVSFYYLMNLVMKQIVRDFKKDHN